MILQSLLDQLKHSDPQTRIDALCALVMLEETDALSLLRQLYPSEAHPEVKQAIAWAGKEIHAAQQRGYTTQAAMSQALRLDRQAAISAQEEEKRKMADLQRRIDIEKMKQHGSTSDADEQMGKATKNTLIGAGIGMGLGFGLPGAVAMGMGMGTAGISSSSLSDGSASDAPKIGEKPIIPPRPSTADIKNWLKRLADPVADGRIKAIIQLGDFNNPTSLGPLGRCYATDAERAVREMAQKIGKQIYFGALYWQNPPATP